MLRFQVQPPLVPCPPTACSLARPGYESLPLSEHRRGIVAEVLALV